LIATTTNSTRIGNSRFVISSNTIYIGDDNVLSIGGYVAWSNLSDGRTKKSIRQNVPGLDFINKLQPVTYNFNLDIADSLLNGKKTENMLASLSKEENAAREAKEKQLYSGFVAQDVERVALSIGYDFSGIDVDEKGVYSLRYLEFVMPLVKAVKELNDKNEKLKDQVNKLSELVDLLLKKRASSH